MEGSHYSVTMLHKQPCVIPPYRTVHLLDYCIQVPIKNSKYCYGAIEEEVGAQLTWHWSCCHREEKTYPHNSATVIAPIHGDPVARFQSTREDMELSAFVRLVASLSSHRTIGRDYKKKQYNISGLYKIFPQNAGSSLQLTCTLTEWTIKGQNNWQKLHVKDWRLRERPKRQGKTLHKRQEDQLLQEEQASKTMKKAVKTTVVVSVKSWFTVSSSFRHTHSNTYRIRVQTCS